MNYFPRLASNPDPADLCLLSSYDYRSEPLSPGLTLTLSRPSSQHTGRAARNVTSNIKGTRGSEEE
jgi:hypothetical protein